MLEALWSVGFITGQGLHGAGVVIFETGRVFGGDSYFYWVGSYSVGDGTITGEVDVRRHMEGLPFIFPGLEGGRVRFTGPINSPTMLLTGSLVNNPTQQIAVQFTRLAELPNP
jgi:T3SS negative regulator,GrlR